MSDRFSAVVGRKVVSRESAEEVGKVTHVVIDANAKRITALVVGKGRNARLVDWERLSGLGPDAAMVGLDGALRDPEDDREHAAADGKLDLPGKRALQETGDELGQIDDVVFDPDTGQLDTLLVGRREHPASALLGAGSYAVVLAADTSN